MPFYSWLLSSLLVSQISRIPPVPVTAIPPATNSPAVIARGPRDPSATSLGLSAKDGAGPREPEVNPARMDQSPALPIRATPAQLVTDALTLPPGGVISGQPVSLLSVVATAPERQRQIEAVHSYWHLVEALGNYHFCYDCQQRLMRLKAGNDEAADLRTAQAVAAAQVREAELQITTGQHDLAEILLLTPGTPLPLPADQPLVGPYRTLYAELFAGKKAPERARTLDQTLPLRNRAIDSHASALLAAEDALDAALELQSSGQGRLAGVLAALDAQVQQQKAFLACVCRYNHDIANYALVAVSPQTTPELLVGTLIKLNRPAGQPVMPLPTTAAIPASYQQPLATSPAVISAIPNLPTRAGLSGFPPGRTPEIPTPARLEAAVPANAPAVLAPPNLLRSNELEEPQLAPPQESAIPLLPEKATGFPQPAGETKTTNGPATRTSQKPIGESAAPQAFSLEMYPGLASLLPAERTVKFTAALYGDRSRPSLAGQPVRLIDCLRGTPVNGRSSVVECYWNARQMAVQYQSFADQIAWLEALGPTLSAQNPPSPLAMLKVRTARLAVVAERADVEADWRVAQFELAGLTGLGTEKILPQPASLPFVGRFPLAAPSPPRAWPQRRLDATIPLGEQAMIHQAAAVVAADGSRAAATADFLAGRSAVERVLADIEVQAHETSAFLRSVRAYNRAISQYTTATLPKNVPAEKVVAALMVE